MLAIGLYLSFTGRIWLYPGAVLLAGSACWGVFLLLNDPWWNSHEDQQDPDGSPPLGSTLDPPGPEAYGSCRRPRTTRPSSLPCSCSWRPACLCRCRGERLRVSTLEFP
jgi:hypothetical protein